MIHKTEDLRYLLKLEDYEILPENDYLEALQKIWSDILQEYSESEDSNTSIIQFSTNKKVLNFELEYLVLWNLYNLMCTVPDSQEVLTLKKEAGYSDKNIKWIEKRLKILNNLIRINRKDIKEKQPENVDFDFYRIIDEIEDIKGRNLDIHKTTVRQYIAIKKNIKEKERRGRQNNSKGRNR